MATPLTASDVGGLLQTSFAKDPKTVALFDNFPLWNDLPKRGNIGGDSIEIAVIYQAATRVGSDPSSVYANTQLAPAAKFALTPKTQYGYSALTGIAMAQSGSGESKKALASFINARHAENMIVLGTMAKLHALYLARGGTGSLGVVDSTTNVGTTILVLAKKSQEYNFEEGQVLQLAATDGGAPRAGTITISAVPGNGTLVMTGNITAGIAAAAVGDFIVMKGDGQTASFPGLKSWCPFNTTKGTFGGVNRDLAPRKLAGFFVDASAEGLTIDAGISAALSRYKANVGVATDGYLNPMDYEALAQSGSTNVMVDQGGDRTFGFRSLIFISDGMRVKFKEDPTIEMGECWVLDRSKWEIGFVAKPEIAIEDRDGLTLRKRGTSGEDAWEMTFVSYPYGLLLKGDGIPGRALLGVKLYA